MNPIKIAYFNIKPTGCSFFRQMLPYVYLQMLGKVQMDVIAPRILVREEGGKKRNYELVINDVMKKQVADCDILFFGREWLTQAWDLLLLAKKLGKKVIYELDDNLFLVPFTNPASFLYNRSDVQDACKKFISASDAVFVSVDTLKTYHLPYNKNVQVLPNMMFTPFYEPRAEFLLEYTRNKGDKVRICWSGSSTHYDDLKQLYSVIYELTDRYKNTEWLFVGYMPPDFAKLRGVKGIQGNPDIFQYFNIVSSLNIDITLAPLSDHEFNSYKSNIRILEGWINKTAVISSDSFEYAKSITYGVDGLLAKKHKHWVAGLSKLITDKGYRDTLIAGGQQSLQKYTLENNIQQYYDAINGVMGREKEQLNVVNVDMNTYRSTIKSIWQTSAAKMFCEASGQVKPI